MDYIISLEDIFEAYFECRKNKRRTVNALRFEIDYEPLCVQLWKDINEGTYSIGKSIAFIVTRPKPREVFAATFRDRIVHHLIARRLDEFEGLMNEYDEDRNTLLIYTRALYHFVKGDKVGARKYLKMAFEANIYVPNYLLDMEMIEFPIAENFEEGDKVEAMYYYQLASETWLNADKALYWLIDEFFKYIDKKDIKVGFSKEEAVDSIDDVYRFVNGR